MGERESTAVAASTKRWRRRVAAAAVATLTSVVSAGCANGPGRAVAQHGPAGPVVSPVASLDATVNVVPLDVAAVAAVRQAVTVTTALRSYAFRASQQLTGGSAAQETTLIGRATRPGALAYTLTVGGQTQQMVNVAGRTYLQLPSAPWKSLDKSSSPVDPVASMLPLLTGLTQPTLTGRTLRGLVSTTVLQAAGMAPAGTTTVGTAGAVSTPVTFTLDLAGEVTALNLRIVVKAGVKLLTVTQRTTFSLFNAAPAITAPGNLR